MLSWLEKGLDEGAVFPFCWYLALYASMAGWLERIFVMRSAFVDLVVVGIFARVQISLRSATLRDLLWKSQQRGRKEGEDGRHTVLRPLNGKRGSCARDERPVEIGLAQAQTATANGPIMEDGINQLFHPAYPLPPQHQPFSDSHDVVQDQYHRMWFPPSCLSLTIPTQQPLTTSTAFTIDLPRQMTTLLLPLPLHPRLAMNPSHHSLRIPHPLPIRPRQSHLLMTNLFM